MRVLIACEESQEVCIAFREKGHQAFSCDIQPCSGRFPEWHIHQDVLGRLNDGWDMMIAFPPCTHLASSGARHFEQKRIDGRQRQGTDFFMKLVNAPIEKKAIENPVGIMSSIYRKPDQIIQPYYFGDTFQKTTCLWLYGLPKLPHYSSGTLYNKQTHVGKGEFVLFPSGKKMPKWYAENKSAANRSKTFPGIARAMALHWG